MLRSHSIRGPDNGKKEEETKAAPKEVREACLQNEEKGYI